MIYHTLEQINLRSLHDAFLLAFSDYQVPMSLSFTDFERMMRRRGLVSKFSVGAFDGEKLVGFSLTGLRLQNGFLTAYDIATGIAPGFRRQGISGEVFKREMAILKSNHVVQYLLEVLKENVPAIRLYQRQGFQIQRGFSCFQIDHRRLTLRSQYQAEKIAVINWGQAKAFWDFEPSWQNSAASVSATPEEFINVVVRIHGEIAGYGIIDSQTGNIPQLAVSPQFRRLGIGTSILAELKTSTVAERIRVLNIEEPNDTVIKFLTVLGFENYVSQFEMILHIND